MLFFFFLRRLSGAQSKIPTELNFLSFSMTQSKKYIVTQHMCVPGYTYK